MEITRTGVSEAKNKIILANKESAYNAADEKGRREMLSEYMIKKISFDIIERVGSISEDPSFKPVKDWPLIP